MLVYLSGPMTGYDEHNYPAFDRAAETLRANGHEVLNPAETAGGSIHLPRETFLEIDIGYVRAADALVLLPGWANSEGAKLEVDVARSLGKRLYLFNSESGIGDEIELTEVILRWRYTESHEDYTARLKAKYRPGGCAA